MSQKFSDAMSISYPPTGEINNIFATLLSGSVGVATLKINREQIKKRGFGGWLLQEKEGSKLRNYCSNIVLFIRFLEGIIEKHMLESR